MHGLRVHIRDHQANVLIMLFFIHENHVHINYNCAKKMDSMLSFNHTAMLLYRGLHGF